MWWQVLPPLGIIGLGIAVPFIAPGVIHYVVTGRPTMRRLTQGYYFSTMQKQAFLRDVSITGNESASRGFDYLPDEN